MNWTPAVLWLQASEAPVGSPLGSFFPLIAIFLIFYLLLFRPQQKKQRERDAMLKAIEKGDEVVTTGGLHGKITGITDEVLTLEIAVVKNERVLVKVARSAIESSKKGESS
jgi:preprotein translocase subunit YajC